jgi:hypothetical protein
MSRTDWELYKESEDYTVKKTKYTDQKGKKSEYCDSEWSKDGIEFYNEVRKRWRDIAFTNNHGIWSNLEVAGPSMQRRMNLETFTVKRRQD